MLPAVPDPTPDKAVARAAGDDEAWALIKRMTTRYGTVEEMLMPIADDYPEARVLYARRIVAAAGAAKTGGA
jgi:hypothetical protein